MGRGNPYRYGIKFIVNRCRGLPWQASTNIYFFVGFSPAFGATAGLAASLPGVFAAASLPGAAAPGVVVAAPAAGTAAPSTATAAAGAASSTSCVLGTSTFTSTS